MSKIPVIVIFDIGRTNKKCVLFDENYRIVFEQVTQFDDIKDDDGDACEDLAAIAQWMKSQLDAALNDETYEIRGINFSTHGAAFVHLDAEGNPVAPLYDYMKPLNAGISADFYALFGGKKYFSAQTGSPALDLLNSGAQLYWLKRAKPHIFEKIAASLHLPQYANYLFSNEKHADYTSIGCHTGLWNFAKNDYHAWMQQENIRRLLLKAESGNIYDIVDFGGRKIPVGIGLHDSSASLIPFTKSAAEPFVLLSSGTWNITLNPFFASDLTEQNYAQDCLYFLSEGGRKVAAARLFLGNEYHFQMEQLQKYFCVESQPIDFQHADESILKVLLRDHAADVFYPQTMRGTGVFPNLAKPPVNLAKFSSYKMALHKMTLDLAYLQKKSIELICGDIRRLYVGGGFIRNALFLEILQSYLPDWEIFIVENAMTSAIGAAVVLHETAFGKPLEFAPCPVRRFASKLRLDLTEYIPISP